MCDVDGCAVPRGRSGSLRPAKIKNAGACPGAAASAAPVTRRSAASTGSASSGAPSFVTPREPTPVSFSRRRVRGAKNASMRRPRVVRHRVSLRRTARDGPRGAAIEQLPFALWESYARVFRFAGRESFVPSREVPWKRSRVYKVRPGASNGFLLQLQMPPKFARAPGRQPAREPRQAIQDAPRGLRGR